MSRVYKVSIIITLLLIGVVFEEVIRAQYRQPIEFVILSSDKQGDVIGKALAWCSRRVLLNLRPTGDDVRQLNADAGARYIASLKDQVFARELLTRFLKQGLDLEAVDASQRWTALQMIAINGKLTGVELLLNSGAQPKKMSVNGESLLEVLHRVSKSEPNGAYPEIIKTLEL